MQESIFNEQIKNYTDYVEKALEMGADTAVRFEIEDIFFDSRVVLKCMFGCKDYAVHTQKSDLSIDDYRNILQKYKWGIIIGCEDETVTQNISIEIERACVFDGYYLALSLRDCCLCKKCNKANFKECRYPQQTRPSFHTVGIDILKTVRNLGLPYEIIQNEYNTKYCYAAVFIE